MSMALKHNDSVSLEIAYHHKYMQKQCENVCARENIVKNVFNQLKKPHDSKLHVLHGTSGSGKTTCMAHIASLARKELGDHVLVVKRFLGISQRSLLIHDVLLGLCVELCEVVGVDLETMVKDSTLKRADRLILHFPEFISKLGSKLRSNSNIQNGSDMKSKHENTKSSEKILIILDGVNDLSPLDNAHELLWLPVHLPSNIHLIVSVDPNEYGILERLLIQVPNDDCYSQVGTLSQEAGESLVKTWTQKTSLKKRPRRDQLESLLDAFSHCRLPQYLKLGFQFTKDWIAENKDSNDVPLGKTIRKITENLFENLENKHGDVLIRHTVGYIAVSRWGLNAKELECLLTSNSDVLEEVRPSGLDDKASKMWGFKQAWGTMKTDLSIFLGARPGLGVTVWNFTHRQFHESAVNKYLDKETRSKLLNNMADFLLLVWKNESDKEKLLRPNIEINDEDLEPDEHDNVRNVSELPYYLLQAERVDDLLNHILGNFHWLLAKCTVMSMMELIRDFDLVLEVYENVELDMLRSVLLSCQKLLETENSGTSHFATHLIGYLWSHGQSHPRVIGKVVKEASAWCLESKRYLLVPEMSWLCAPVGHLISAVNGHLPVTTALCLSQDGQFLATGGVDGVVKIWDVQEEQEVTKFSHGDAVVALFMPGQSLMTFTRDNVFTVWDHDNNAILQECRILHDSSTVENGIEDFQPRTKLCITNDRDRVLLLHEYALFFINLVHKNSRMVTDSVTCFELSACDKYFVAGKTNGTVTVRKMEDRKILHEIKLHSHCVTCLSLTKDNICATGCMNGTVKVFNIEDGKSIHEIRGVKEPIRDIVIDKFGLNLAFAYGRTIALWDIVSGEQTHNLADAHLDEIHTLCFNSASDRYGEVLLSASKNDSVKIWDVGRAKVLSSLTCASDQLVFGNEMMATFEERTNRIHVWNLDPLQEVNVPRFLPSPTLAPDIDLQNRLVVSSAKNDKCLLVHDMVKGDVKRFLTGNQESVKIIYCVQVENRNYVLTIDKSNRVVKVWDTSTGDQVFTKEYKEDIAQSSCCLKSQKVVFVLRRGSVDILNLLTLYITTVKGLLVIAPNVVELNEDMFVYCTDSALNITSLQRPKFVTRLRTHKYSITQVSTAPSAGYIVTYTKAEGIYLWNVKKGKAVRKIDTLGFPGPIQMKIMSNGLYVCIACDSHLTVIDLKSTVHHISQYTYSPITCLKTIDNTIAITTKDGYLGIFQFHVPSQDCIEEDKTTGSPWWQKHKKVADDASPRQSKNDGLSPRVLSPTVLKKSAACVIL